jgi:hypothetical protein
MPFTLFSPHKIVKKMSIQLKLSTLLFSVIMLMFIEKTTAQKGIEQITELPKNRTHITKELEAQITEVVSPVKEIIEKLLNEDASGNYGAYKDAINKAKEIKDTDEKNKYLQNIQKKFYPFFKSIWGLAKIDEVGYQQKLKSLFPEQFKETIRFTDFLNFTMGGGSQKPTPPPPPAPAKICLNAHDFFRGTFGMDGGAIGGTRVQVVRANPPSPAEIVAVADAVILGTYRGQGWVRNTIGIPANFPNNNKSIRIIKTFDWRGSATAFSIIGMSWATIAFSTNGNSTDFNNGGEIYTVVAPVTFVYILNKKTSTTEETVVSKTDLTSIQFGITCYVQASSSIFLSYANARSMCALMKWELCEE